MARKILLIPLIILPVVLLYRAYVVFQPDKSIFEPCSPLTDNHSLQFDTKRLQAFQTLLQFQTVSYEEFDQNITELERCRDFIKQRYQSLTNKYSQFVQLHDIAKYSLLYSIQGKNPALKPFLFSAHMDVVPAKYIDRWKHPPFEAFADEEFIYARGTLDDK